MARAAQIAAAEQIGDTVLQRRQHRSFIEDDSPPTTAPRGLLLSSHAIDVCAAGRGKDPRVHRLLVMKKDGTKRGARDIYEWLQQFCVEQCAVLLALQEELPAFTKDSYMPLPCQLGRADGYEAPQLCMGCASWWTDQGWNDGKSYKDEPELFNRLVRDWRRTERPAQIVLAKVHPQGALLFELVQPFLQLPPMATHFPCTRDKLGSFIEEVSAGEYESTYHKEPSGLETFFEHDAEDGLQGGYWLAHVPMAFVFDSDEYGDDEY